MNILRRRRERFRRAQQSSAQIDLYQVLLWTLERNNYAIEMADAKAAIITTFSGAFLAVIVQTILNAFRNLGAGVVSDGSMGSAAPLVGFSLLLGVFIWGLVVTIVEAFRSLTPTLILPDPPGYTFFADVARQDWTRWHDRVLRAQPHDLIDDLSQQVHATSRIATMKNQHLRRSMRWVIYWLPLGLILYIVSLLLGGTQ
jgi:hypothetical protein